MKQVVNEEREKVAAFWRSFFPEIKNDEDYNRIITTILDKTVEEVIECREKENAQDINALYFGKFNHIPSEMQKLDDVLQKYCQWLYFFEPIVAGYYEKYVELINSAEFIKDKKQFTEKLFKNIYFKLMNMGYRTLVQETGIAEEENLLKGNNSEEKNEYYCKQLLRNPEYLKEIYSIYPELIRLLDIRVRDIYVYIGEIFENIECAKNRTIDFNFDTLEELEIGQGDTHNGGRSVVKLTFNNGNVYYKPRSMKIEKSFIKFQKWLKENCPEYKADFTYKIWDVGNAGFMKQIDNNECKSDQEINEFYYKIGQLLCVLYTFNAKDFHSENVIADGNTPVLIDMETLLHVSFENELQENIIFEVSKKIEESVIGTALLPTLLPNMKTNEVMEVGGIGRACKQFSPFKTQVLRNVGSTDVRIEFVNKEILPNKNHPVINGKPVGCTDYLEVIRDGFQQVYNWIECNKEAYIAEIKSVFGDIESRAIIKNTNVYNQLIETGFHPDLLHNKWDRNIYLCRLGMFLVQKDEWKYKNVYQYEYNELNRGDIPIFFVVANKDKLYTNDGKAFHQINKGQTVVDTLEKKVKTMDLTDCQRQLALINQSFLGCKIKTDLPEKTKTVFVENDKEIEIHEGNIATAEKIANLCGQRSINKAIENENHSMWIGMMGFGNDYYRITPIGLSIYRGNGGLAYFYYELYKKTRKKEYLGMAEKTFGPVLKHLLEHEVPEDYEGWGAFTGIASELYMALYVYKNGFSSKLNAEVIENILENNICPLKEYIKNENQIDFLSGMTGILGVYIAAYKLGFRGKKNSISCFLEYLGNMLVECAQEVDDDKNTWFIDNIGYAHGNAGVISQMARLYDITKNDVLKDCINKALRYERENGFDKETGKWRFRKGAHYYSWCNGIGGLLLEKLILKDLKWKDDMLLDEINTLCAQLKRTGFGNDSSICHGDMGSILLLKQSARVLKDKDLFEKCVNTEQNFLNRYLYRYWNKLILKEDWSLMTGLSGVGLSLIADEELIDILSLT
ncbi:type 2 lantibiotic biosynthesis protein LanM [Pseudobutyrivibrio sp. YE44]|uniref:type 2 lanthipeptide synthetase LanM n=1 Tax=Pseudobutyrivibrio sp. YE44 TaxID=1520802 RepID=UPI0008921ECB|nr:type 2 lanthipeptide synthetase LanM [Pseudobutyrivibrio sp. YE44]SDB23666.1 type 2 lantibiotic biosynthesis protein LanM [Pseudobutyrivibrio sp. YE44]